MNFAKLYKISTNIFSDFIILFITNLPGALGDKLRYIFYKTRLKSIGRNVLIDTGVSFSGTRLISIGDNVHIDKNCIISTGIRLQGQLFRKNSIELSTNEGEIFIGDNIHICPNCILVGYGGLYIDSNSTISAGTKLYSLTNIAYNPDNRSEVISIMPYEQAPFLIGPIVLRSNVWLGLNCIVMPNVVIGENSFVSSNSLVVASFGSNSYIGGEPAEFIKNRFN
jgi:acetyltransferase-like isoleucine patch superfamily enzyme